MAGRAENRVLVVMIHNSYIRQAKLRHRCVSEEALFSHEAGRHFILNFGIYCPFHHDEAGIFKCFRFIWKSLIR